MYKNNKSNPREMKFKRELFKKPGNCMRKPENCPEKE
jgi:hypothetical protein